MDSLSFGAFQQQIKRNQEELTDYLKELDSWKESISKADNALKSDVIGAPDDKLPPVRNSLQLKKKVKRKKPGKSLLKTSDKPSKIPGYDFRAWDKFDVDKALKEIDNKSESSSYEEETDEEWEEQKYKQQALFEKDQGNDYFNKGKYEEAIQCYTKGITCDPVNAVLYANRAMALLKQEKFGAVEKDCTDAIALDPTYVKAYMRRATARHKLGKLQAAVDDYKQTIKLEPENKAALKEITILEKELKISSEGIVLPIKLSPSQRSKKPLIRIQIEEIGLDDMKQTVKKVNGSTPGKQEEHSPSQTRTLINSKLVEEVSNVNSDPVKLIKQSNPEEMFTAPADICKTYSSPADISKTYTSPADISKTYTSPADISKTYTSPADISKTYTSPAGISKTYTSPSDISKTSSPNSETALPNNTAAENNSSADNFKVPLNSFQFQRDWKCVKTDTERAYNYIQLIHPTQYAKLFGESLEADLLSSLFNLFSKRFLRDGVNITEHLYGLAKVKRFSMSVMLMSSKDKSVIKDILDNLAQMENVKQEDLKELRRIYQL